MYVIEKGRSADDDDETGRFCGTLYEMLNHIFFEYCDKYIEAEKMLSAQKPLLLKEGPDLLRSTRKSYTASEQTVGVGAHVCLEAVCFLQRGGRFYQATME